MFLASNCTCAIYFTYTTHVPLLAKNMAATHVHAFAYAFAYAIKQTPYAFVAKIILCMYLLYALGNHEVNQENYADQPPPFKNQPEYLIFTRIC